MTEKRLDPAEKVTVWTTFRPDMAVEMTATEAEDLRRQGLLAKPPAEDVADRTSRTAGAKGEKA